MSWIEPTAFAAASCAFATFAVVRTRAFLGRAGDGPQGLGHVEADVGYGTTLSLLFAAACWALGQWTLAEPALTRWLAGGAILVVGSALAFFSGGAVGFLGGCFSLAGYVQFLRGSPSSGMAAALVGAGIMVAQQWAAYEAGRQREALLQRISHRLRTPAAAIRSLVDALDAGAFDDPAERRRGLGLIRGEADRLGTGLDRLLRAARGDADPEAKKVPLDLSEWARGVASRWRLRLPKLAVDAPAAPLPVEADPEQLEEAADALLDNAMRYGGPNVRLAVRAGAEVEVADDGPGVKTGEPARGHGLGLETVAAVARAHGGRLRTEEGRRFVVELPPCPAPASCS